MYTTVRCETFLTVKKLTEQMYRYKQELLHTFVKL